MTGDERRETLADQAAAWVPPWERPDIEPQADDSQSHVEVEGLDTEPESRAEASEPGSLADEPVVSAGDPASPADAEAEIAEPAAAAEPAAGAEPVVDAEPTESLAEAEPGVDEPSAGGEADAAPQVPAGVPTEADEPADVVADVDEATAAAAPAADDHEPAVGASSSEAEQKAPDAAPAPAEAEAAEPATAAELGAEAEPVTDAEPAPAAEPGAEAGPATDAEPSTAAGLGADAELGADEPADPEAETAAETAIALAPAALAADVEPAVEEQSALALIDDAELKAALEAILLVVDEPVTEIVLAQILEQPTERVTATLILIAEGYTAAGHGFDLRKVAGGWRLYTRPEYAPYVERFVLDGQSVRLTQAALETLAVIAYKQPVTRSRISAIRGVNCDGVIRTLVSRGLVEECGTEPESGAFLYRTTTLFLEKLGMNSVNDLPPLAPFLPDDVEEIADAAH